MNPEDHLNQLLKEAQVTTSTAVDEYILTPAQQTLNRPRRLGKGSALGMSLRIAAVILLGLCAWWALPSNPRSNTEPRAGALSSSPAQTLSLQSLHRACLGGNIETLEAHLDRALTLVGPRPTDLLDEVLSQSSNES